MCNSSKSLQLSISLHQPHRSIPMVCLLRQLLLHVWWDSLRWIGHRSWEAKTPKMISFCWAWKILSHARLKYLRPLWRRFMPSEPWIILYRYNKFLIFELSMLESLSLCSLLNNLAVAAIFLRWCLGPSRRSQVVVESELRRLKIPADGVWPLSCSWIQVDG